MIERRTSSTFGRVLNQGIFTASLSTVHPLTTSDFQQTQCNLELSKCVFGGRGPSKLMTPLRSKRLKPQNPPRPSNFLFPVYDQKMAVEMFELSNF